MLINSNINPNYTIKKKNKLFTVMSLLYQILFILGGMDHGFFRYKIVPVKVVKLYSFILCVALNITAFINIIFVSSLFRYSWLISVVIKYDLYILHLIFLRNNNYFFNLFEDLSVIDSKSGIGSSTDVEMKLLISCFGWICVQSFSSLTYCYITQWCISTVRYSVANLMAICSDLFILTYAFMFYTIYSRMKQLSILLTKTESEFSTPQCIYRLYVDTIEKYKKAFDQTVSKKTFLLNIRDELSTFFLTVKNTHKYVVFKTWLSDFYIFDNLLIIGPFHFR